MLDPLTTYFKLREGISDLFGQDVCLHPWLDYRELFWALRNDGILISGQPIHAETLKGGDFGMLFNASEEVKTWDLNILIVGSLYKDTHSPKFNIVFDVQKKVDWTDRLESMYQDWSWY